MVFDRNGNCWCGSGVKYKHCHMEMDERIMEYKRKGYKIPGKRMIKNREQIEGIRASGRMNTMILDYISEKMEAGITTEEIDRYIHEKTIQLGGTPATLGYEGFPKSVCVSINNEVCHGIPSDHRILKEGDIVNVDVSTIYNGYFGDSSRMFCIGNVSEERKNLVNTAKQAVAAGLGEVKPWRMMGDMGQAVNDYVKAQGCSVVYAVGGHGVGLKFHEDPYVSYVSKKHTGILMVPGMIFTIEPMVNQGSPEVVIDDENGWTIYTEDGSDSAQWEVMVLVTEEGHEVLAY